MRNKLRGAERRNTRIWKGMGVDYILTVESVLKSFWNRFETVFAGESWRTFYFRPSIERAQVLQ
jgi:hypothetical protein